MSTVAPTPFPFRKSDIGLRGPELLEQLAERHANNGFELEADVLQRAAREWRTERETGVETQPDREALPIPAGTVLCEMIETDFRAGTIQVRAIGKFRVGSGRYWLMPLVHP